jgi:hypothetical protein
MSDFQNAGGQYTVPMARMVDINGVAPDKEVAAQQILAVGREHGEALFAMLARAIGACEIVANQIEHTSRTPAVLEMNKPEILAYRATAFGLTALNNDVLAFLKANGWRPNG